MEYPGRSASLATTVALIFLTAPLGGCGVRGAPSYVLFGSYFPGWMFCAVIGIAGAIGARIAMVLSGLNDILPFQLFVCASAGLIVAAAAWLIWFGR